MDKKQKRQSISFPQAVYDQIRMMAIAQGYKVGAGRDSQIAKCVADNLFAKLGLELLDQDTTNEKQP